MNVSYLRRNTPVWLLSLTAALFLRLGGATPSTPLLPVEQFFAEPEMRSLEVSPGGKYLAFLTTLGTGKVGIALMDLASGKVEALVAAKDENIESFFWKSDDYIIYGGDIGGNENAALRSIRISTRNVVPLTESFQEDITGRTTPGANVGSLANELRFDPTHILILGNKGTGSMSFQYYRLDVRDGSRRSIDMGDAKPDSDAISDNDGNIRARMRSEGDKLLYEIRATPLSSFEKVAESTFGHPKWLFLEFGADNETLYFINTERIDTGELQTLNVRTKQVSAPLFSSAEGEIEGVMLSWDRTKLYGVSYETDKSQYHFFDQDRAHLQQMIDASLPGNHNYIVSRSQDEKIMVVASVSDRDPGVYYLLDLRHPRLMAVGRINHFINPAQMRPMEPIQFQARDGLVLHGYLTRPAGSEGKPVPLIVNPHGGPYGPRDHWGFNSEVQFLASRGYAVLQINYRGSGGYGTKFEEAGYKEWGGKMQNDLTDGVKWAIAQGVATPDKVAIYGASYGGYAALAGATFTPDLYKCAINYVGVADLNLIAGKGVAGRADRFYDWHASERVGDNPDYMHDRSPVNFVDRIQIPTLHAYGFNDVRVDFRHWERLESKLKQYGKTYDILIMKNEGHGFRKEGNRIAFYRKMEEFLNKYFPAK